jgi:hypothetical protein
MIDSTGLCHVGHKRSGWSAELVVERYAGGECQKAHADAGAQAFGGAGPVAFQAEQVFECLEHRFDVLPDRPQAWMPGVGFVTAGRPDHGGAQVGDLLGELAAHISFVADHQLTAVKASGEHRYRDLAFFPVGADEHRLARGAVKATHQVKPHTPKVPGMAATPPVGGVIRKLGAAGGLQAAAAFHRTGVQKDRVIPVPGDWAANTPANQSIASRSLRRLLW